MYTEDRTEEQVLIMRAQRGEQDAFRVLVERYQSLVYTLALRMVSSPEDAEDAAQEAFLNAWRGLPRFRMDARFSTWLYRLTVNAATDLLRRRRGREDISLDDEDAAFQPADPDDQQETGGQRAHGADRLPPLAHPLPGGFPGRLILGKICKGDLLFNARAPGHDPVGEAGRGSVQRGQILLCRRQVLHHGAAVRAERQMLLQSAPLFGGKRAIQSGGDQIQVFRAVRHGLLPPFLCSDAGSGK